MDIEDIEEVETLDPDSADIDANANATSILKGQLIGSAFYIVVLILSIIILYNQILKIEKNAPFMSEEDVSNINILNRIIVFILVLYFFYTTTQNKRLAEENGKETKYLELQQIASLLTVVSAIIVLYVSLEQSSKSFVPLSATDNPNL